MPPPSAVCGRRRWTVVQLNRRLFSRRAPGRITSPDSASNRIALRRTAPPHSSQPRPLGRRPRRAAPHTWQPLKTSPLATRKAPRIRANKAAAAASCPVYRPSADVRNYALDRTGGPRQVRTARGVCKRMQRPRQHGGGGAARSWRGYSAAPTRRR
eukprot:68341-Chlamydomonas_euryale.AAC.3